MIYLHGLNFREEIGSGFIAVSSVYSKSDEKTKP